jgi:prepilin-type N-terminal cleavage/methylation domain-containing protein
MVGYTLVELLVALIVGGIVLASAGVTLLVFLRSASKYEAGQSTREVASRVNYLIQVEASESKSIVTNFSTTPVPAEVESGCALGSVQPLFMFNVPEAKGEYGEDGETSYILYYRLNGDVRRCGPQVLKNGQIQQGSDTGAVDSSGSPIISAPAYTDGVVMRSASMQVVTSPVAICGSEVSSDRKLVVEMNFTGVPWKPECTIAKAKTVYVCSPAIGTETGADIIGLCATSYLFRGDRDVGVLKNLNHFGDLWNRFA